MSGGEQPPSMPQRIGVPTPIDARSGLPDLPIPNSIGGGEASAPLVPIGLPLEHAAGGASVTVADGTEATSADLQASPIDLQSVELQRFSWTIASELTSGMLSNPARGNATVKDALALFDHVLNEVRTYVQLSEGTDSDVALGAERQRRAEHWNRFHDGDAPAAPSAGQPQGVTGHPQPRRQAAQGQAQQHAQAITDSPAPAKPAPAEPIVIPRYRDLGMSGPMANEHLEAQPRPAAPPQAPRRAGGAYAPGSMAGVSPEPPAEDEHESAAA